VDPANATARIVPADLQGRAGERRGTERELDTDGPDGLRLIGLGCPGARGVRLAFTWAAGAQGGRPERGRAGRARRIAPGRSSMARRSGGCCFEPGCPDGAAHYYLSGSLTRTRFPLSGELTVLTHCVLGLLAIVTTWGLGAAIGIVYGRALAELLGPFSATFCSSKVA
jgi:hypothetical protein